MNEQINDSRIGLILEGGGQRGIYTAGILDEFLKAGIDFDGIFGVSAGILRSLSYVSKQYGRDARYIVKYSKDKKYMSMYSFLKTGNINDKDFCYNELPNKLALFDYDTFKERAKDIEIYSVCTNVETGKAEYIRIFDIDNREEQSQEVSQVSQISQMEAVRASASLPILSKIVEYDGMKLLDGGTADSIPIKASIERGFKKNLIILTRPEGYVKKPDNTISIMKKIYADYPEYVETAANRYIEYNKTLEYIKELEEKGEALVIRPSRDMKVSRTEKSEAKLKRMYKLGRYDAQKMLDEIKKFVLS